MKTRLTLIFSALVVLLGAMIWVVKDRSDTVAEPLLAARPVTIRVVTAPEQLNLGEPTSTPATAPVAVAAPAATPAVTPPALVAPVAAIPAQVNTSPMIHVDKSGEMTYVARSGDTVSQLAIALLGSDSKEHRDAIVAANASLQANPDRVLAGQTYSIASVLVPAEANVDDQDAVASPVAAEVAAPVATSPKEDAVVVASGPRMKYTAQRGDSVSTLASALLGGDTKANREAIIGANTSLQEDPDHLVAGKSYTITAPNGLAADANASPSSTVAKDVDDATRMSVGRSLRYTAQPGDSVSKLATVLLGSDTPANRDLIIKSNPTLLQDPDHLVAGKTYWITAPIADSMP